MIRRSAGSSAGTRGSMWESAPTELTRRCAFVEVYGDTGSGRTTFALSAPGPIALIHAAEKIEGIVQPFARLGKIGGVANFGRVLRGDDSEVQRQAMEAWRGLEEAWFDAFNWARTIVLDTHTEAWELIRLAYFGDLKPSRGRVDANYGPVNARWRGMFKKFRHQDTCNVILIGQTKEEYKEKKGGGSDGMGQRTGNTIRAGQKEIPFMADVTVRTKRGPDGEFLSEIQKGWWNAQAEGLELEGEMSNFPQVMAMVTETEPEEWT